MTKLKLGCSGAVNWMIIIRNNNNKKETDIADKEKLLRLFATLPGAFFYMWHLEHKLADSGHRGASLCQIYWVFEAMSGSKYWLNSD